MTEAIAPATGIKDYIINARKGGYPDSAILDSLKKVKWPEDIIQEAFKQANLVVQAVPEKQQEPAGAAPAAGQPGKTAEAQASAPAKEGNSADMQSKAQTNAQPSKPAAASAGSVPNDLFTKPPAEVFPEQLTNAQMQQKTGGFSFMVILAFLLSPIPFIGLGIAGNAIDGIKKYKQSGMFLAIIAIIINLASIAFVLYVIYQIFSFEPGQMQGFAKYVNDMLHLTG